VAYSHRKFKSMRVQVWEQSEQKKGAERKYSTSNEQFWDILP